MSQPRRPYGSTLREEQARATQRTVVHAARDLFIEVGWSGTTIDPVAAAVHAESERNRLVGAEFVVARLAAIGGLRPDLTTERAVATLVLMDPAVHRTLVREHRWTTTEYADWIERTAMAELLRDTSKEA